MKYKHAWIRLSAILLLFTRFSCSRYESKRDSIFSTMGLQLGYAETCVKMVGRRTRVKRPRHLSSLLTKSPNPGVSTTVKCKRTPLSSISIRKLRIRGHELDGWINIDVPAPILSIATVLGLSSAGAKGTLGGYKVVLKSVLIRVDLPRPDSPSTRGNARKWFVAKT